LADLILTGGHRADVEKLIEATVGHNLRQRFPQHKNDDWVEDNQLIERHSPEWLQRISRHWAKKQECAAIEKPKTVSEMARANLRGSLRGHVEEFIGSARMHELYLLDNVLLTFESSNGGPDNSGAESKLAEAFMFELDSDRTYVKVSRDQVETVEEYIASLSSIPDKEDEMAELTRLWRQDHSEPTKGSSARPSGHLGRGEESGD